MASHTVSSKTFFHPMVSPMSSKHPQVIGEPLNMLMTISTININSMPLTMLATARVLRPIMRNSPQISSIQGNQHCHQIDPPVWHNLIGAHGFGKLGGIRDFAHAGVNKHQPDIYPEKKRKVFAGGDENDDLAQVCHGSNRPPTFFQAAVPPLRIETFLWPLSNSLLATSTSYLPLTVCHTQ